MATARVPSPSYHSSCEDQIPFASELLSDRSRETRMRHKVVRVRQEESTQAVRRFKNCEVGWLHQFGFMPSGCFTSKQCILEDARSVVEWSLQDSSHGCSVSCHHGGTEKEAGRKPGQARDSSKAHTDSGGGDLQRAKWGPQAPSRKPKPFQYSTLPVSAPTDKGATRSHHKAPLHHGGTIRPHRDTSAGPQCRGPIFFHTFPETSQEWPRVTDAAWQTASEAERLQGSSSYRLEETPRVLRRCHVSQTGAYTARASQNARPDTRRSGYCWGVQSRSDDARMQLRQSIALRAAGGTTAARRPHNLRFSSRREKRAVSARSFKGGL